MTKIDDSLNELLNRVKATTILMAIARQRFQIQFLQRMPRQGKSSF